MTLEIREYNAATGHSEVVHILPEAPDESRLAEAWTIALTWSNEDSETDHVYIVTEGPDVIYDRLVPCQRCGNCQQCRCGGKIHECSGGELR